MKPVQSSRAPSAGYPGRSSFDTRQITALRAILHESPSKFGKLSSTWTQQLDADVCYELGITPKLASRSALTSALKRVGVDWNRAKAWIGGPPLALGHAMNGQLLCVYCGREYPESSFKVPEHVIPQAIGGAVQPTNPFELRQVCSKCNHKCGQYVDGRFIHSWLTQNQRASEQAKYVDPSHASYLPLRFIGTSRTIESDGRECDFWYGPRVNDVICHFHRPYPAEEGDPPHLVNTLLFKRRPVDPGYVIVFLEESSVDWQDLVLKSVEHQFRKSALYLVNSDAARSRRFKPVPLELIPLVEALSNTKEAFDERTDPLYGDRFEAKVALGLGAMLLNPGFIDSADADLLRRFLWCLDDVARQTIPVHGTRIGQPIQDLTRFMSWPGGHVLMLRPFPNIGLALSLTLYGEQTGVTLVTTNPSHWQGKFGEAGVVYVIVPGLQRLVGPIDGSTFIGWKVIRADPKPSPSMQRFTYPLLDDLEAATNALSRSTP